MSSDSLPSESVSDALQQFAVTPPSVTILSDHAARGTLDLLRSPDRLDLRSRLAGIYDILRHRNTECPVAIALYGDWGSGKTSAMRWLETRLTEWNARTPAQRGASQKPDKILPHPRVHPVWFDPWKYHTREDVWRGIIAEVILGLLSVRSDWSPVHIANVKFAAKRFGSFLGRGFLTALSHLKFKVGASAGMDDKARGISAKADAGVEVSGAMFEDIVQDWKDYRQPEKGFLNEFEDTLHTFIKECIPNAETPHGHYYEDRIVLFIDDLDRCLPAVALEVLEALKLYLNMPAIAFVVGLDETVVQSVVQEHYKKVGVDQIKARDYLAKLFQVELRIAPTATQMEGYLGAQLAALDQVTGGYWSRNLTAQHRTIIEGALTALTGGNPREIKRQLNSSLLYARSIAENDKLLPGDKKLEAEGRSVQKKENFASGLACFFIHRLIFRFYSALQGRFTTIRSEHDWLQAASKIRRDRLWSHSRLLELVEWTALDSEGRQKLSQRNPRASGSFVETFVAALEGPVTTAEDQPSGDKASPPPGAPPAPKTWEAEWIDLYLTRPTDKDGPIQSDFFTDTILWDLLEIPFSASLAQFAPTFAAAAPPPAAFDIRALPPRLQEALLAATGQSLEDFHPAALASVEKLDLHHLELQDADLAFLRYCIGLRVLRLWGNPVTAAGLAPLASLAHLVFLSLAGDRLRTPPPLPEGIQELSLDYCTGLTSVAGLPAGVQTLSLSGCTRLTSVAGLPAGVQTLYLSDCTGLAEVGVLPPGLKVVGLHETPKLPAAVKKAIRALVKKNGGEVHE